MKFAAVHIYPLTLNYIFFFNKYIKKPWCFLDIFPVIPLPQHKMSAHRQTTETAILLQAILTDVIRKDQQPQTWVKDTYILTREITL